MFFSLSLMFAVSLPCFVELFLMFYSGSKHLIDFLLQKGVKPGTLTKNHFSALHLATYKVDNSFKYFYHMAYFFGISCLL